MPQGNQRNGDGDGQRRKTPFSVFQGAKDAGRLSNRSRRAIERATGRGRSNGNGNGNSNNRSNGRRRDRD